MKTSEKNRIIKKALIKEYGDTANISVKNAPAPGNKYGWVDIRVEVKRFRANIPELSYVENIIRKALENVIEKDSQEEVKCEVCNYGLGRTEKYGRNLCNKCQEKLI